MGSVATPLSEAGLEAAALGGAGQERREVADQGGEGWDFAPSSDGEHFGEGTEGEAELAVAALEAGLEHGLPVGEGGGGCEAMAADPGQPFHDLRLMTEGHGGDLIEDGFEIDGEVEGVGAGHVAVVNGEDDGDRAGLRVSLVSGVFGGEGVGHVDHVSDLADGVGDGEVIDVEAGAGVVGQWGAEEVIGLEVADGLPERGQEVAGDEQAGLAGHASVGQAEELPVVVAKPSGGVLFLAAEAAGFGAGAEVVTGFAVGTDDDAGLEVGAEGLSPAGEGAGGGELVVVEMGMEEQGFHGVGGSEAQAGAGDERRMADGEGEKRFWGGVMACYGPLVKILFVGDVVGGPGRKAVRELLPGLRARHEVEVVVANGENAAGGAGITPDTAADLFAAGVDVITTGDHLWDQKEVIGLLTNESRFVRPVNYPPGTPGQGSAVHQRAGRPAVGVVNVQGRTFMGDLDNPFWRVRPEVERLRTLTPIILVDMHAEATSEKIALARMLDGLVSAVIGTHTHVQTADEQVFPGGTAFLCDAGFTGPHESVLGREIEPIIRRFQTNQPQRFGVAKGRVLLQGAVLEVEEATGRALSIVRVSEALPDPAMVEEGGEG